MKIVVLDGYTLNPGDLSWDAFEKLGSLTVHERSSPAEVLQRAKECDILLTNKAIVSAETIRSCPNLKYIGVLATGVNIVDLDAAREKGIPVRNVAGYSTESVAQLVFAHILNFTHRVGDHANDVSGGGWAGSKDFCYWLTPLIELKDLTLGIVGLGEIGRAVARIGMVYGMRIVATTRNPNRPAPEGVSWRSMDELFAESDFISLHCPLTPETEGLVNASRIQKMKPSAFLVNTGRGPLVNEADLAAALNAGRIAGAGLDVLSAEPPGQDNPLLNASNCFITPHIAWASTAARKRLMKMAAENLESFLQG